MTTSADWARAGLGFVLVVFWAGTIAWLRTGRSPAAIAGVLLSLYLIYPLYALIKPAGQTDPAIRAAQAGLLAIVLLLVFLMVLLILGIRRHRRVLVWIAF